MSCTTPACFSTFFSIYYGPYSSYNFFSVFVYTIIMIMIEIQCSGTALLLVNHAYHIKTMAPCTPVISNIVWKEDTSLPGMFNPLCSSSCLKITSAIKVSPVKIMDDFRYKWKPSQNRHFSQWAKMNWRQRALVSPQRMHCMYSSMAKAPLGLKQCRTAKKLSM